LNHKHSLIFFSGGIILVLGIILIGLVPISVVSESKQDDGDKRFTVEENITIQTESKPIEEMDCKELKEFVMSFEKGWGATISLYNEKCS